MLAMPDAIHVLGYTAKIQESPSNLPDKKKASLPDVGASEKDESLSLKKQTLKSFPQQNQNSIPWISYTHILTTKAYI